MIQQAAATTGPGTVRTGNLGTLAILRWILFLSLTLLLSIESGPDAFASLGGVALGIFLLSNLAIQFFGSALINRPSFTLILATNDTILSALVIMTTGPDSAEILFLFAVVTLLAAMGRELTRIIGATLVVSLTYCWLGMNYREPAGLALDSYLSRVLLLYCVAIYFGHLVVTTRQQRFALERAQRENRELRTILDILETVTTSLDIHHVMRTIVAKIGEVIDADRCSLLFLDRDPETGWVIASSESPEIDMLPLSLRKYPEVQRAIATGSIVLVDDIERNPLMEPVREHLRSGRFDSLLVIPLMFQEELLGALLIRAARRKTGFGPEEIQFCQLVAGASVSALKNAMLYREVQMQTEQHRSTIEQMRNIIENSMDIILTTDLEGRITEFNPMAENALGFRRDDMLGRPITELLSGQNEKRDILSRLRRAGTLQEESTAVSRIDGNSLTLDLTFAAVRNDLGEMVGAVCVGKDPSRVH